MLFWSLAVFFVSMTCLSFITSSSELIALDSRYIESKGEFEPSFSAPRLILDSNGKPLSKRFVQKRMRDRRAARRDLQRLKSFTKPSDDSNTDEDDGLSYLPLSFEQDQDEKHDTLNVTNTSSTESSNQHKRVSGITTPD